MSSLQASHALLGAAISLAMPPPVKPTPVKMPKEEASEGRSFAIGVCVVFVVGVAAFCIFGTIKLLKACKKSLSRRTSRGATRASNQLHTVQSTTPLPQSLSIGRTSTALGAKSHSVTSICSTTFSSPREVKPPPRSAPLFQRTSQLPLSPPSTQPTTSNNAPNAEPTVHQGRQNQAEQQGPTSASVPPAQLAPPKTKSGLLGFWRRQ